MTTSRNHTPDLAPDPAPDTEQRRGLISYLLAPVDFSPIDIVLLTGIAAGSAWLLLDRLLHVRLSVTVMLTLLVALLAFSQFRAVRMRRLAQQDPDEPADGSSAKDTAEPDRHADESSDLSAPGLAKRPPA
ncbi:hypothetical protein GCM10009678_04960 [Actinomadura kijaniata]|uniref:Uncharacterized protein n=1 Tax=Actinomadura namibiensis TaxID=182080 RepID=A0A7W3LTJ5_ACTNM|nr:hypothetical protein [Actinomadura namibiensis]MBA8953940.1 hypothetical protein [Actinomadura namibiensis]